MARQHPYDVEIDTQGYMVARDQHGVPLWAVERVPSERGQAVEIADSPWRWQTWHRGAFYSDFEIPGCYEKAEGIDAGWPGVLIMGPLVTRLTFGGTASVSDFFEEGTYLYALGGRYCKRIDLTDDSIETPNDGADGKDFGSGTVATKAVDFQALNYVGFSSDTHIYSFDGTTWTQSGGDVHATYWAKNYLDNYGWRLWRAYSTNSVSGCLAGDTPTTAANWAAALSVGDTSHAITGLVSGGDDRLWVAKTDGLYGLTSTGRATNALENESYLVDAANGMGLIASGSSVFYPHLMGLLEYGADDGGVRSVTPGGATGNRTTIRGTITAQIRAGGWHYCAVYNGTDSWLVRGRYPTAGESMPEGWVGPVMWHTLAKLTGVKVDCMHLSGLSDPPRLWFGYTVSTTYDIGYIRVPKSGNVLAEATSNTLTFAASGSIWLTPTDWNVPGGWKNLVGFEINNEGCSSSTYVEVYASLDGNDFQRVDEAKAAGRQSLLIPNTLSRATRLQFRLDLTNGTSTTTPRIKPMVGHSAIRYTMRDVLSTTVLCQDGVVRHDNSKDTTPGAELVTHLKNRDNSGPFTLRDWQTGSVRNREVLLHRVTERVIADERNQERPLGYGCDIVLSVLRELPAAWYWDSGFNWDDGNKWR